MDPDMDAFDQALREAEICAASLDPAEEIFHRVVQDIETLHRIKREDKRAKFVVDPDQVLATVGTITSLALVLNYERLHVVATKAFTMVPKLLR